MCERERGGGEGERERGREREGERARGIQCRQTRQRTRVHCTARAYSRTHVRVQTRAHAHTHRAHKSLTSIHIDTCTCAHTHQLTHSHTHLFRIPPHVYATRCVIQQHADTQKHYEDTHFFATFAKKSIEEIERGDWREVVVITAATHGQLFVLTSPLLSARSLPLYLPPFLSPSLSLPPLLSLSCIPPPSSLSPYLNPHTPISLTHTHSISLPSSPVPPPRPYLFLSPRTPRWSATTATAGPLFRWAHTHTITHQLTRTNT